MYLSTILFLAASTCAFPQRNLQDYTPGRPVPGGTHPAIQPASGNPAGIPQIEEKPNSAVSIPGVVDQDTEPQGQPQTLPALIPESSNDDIVIATKPFERPTGPQTKPLPRPSQGQPQTLPALISESSNDDIVIATKPLPRPTGPQVQPAPIHPARVPQIEERPISAVAIPGEVEQDSVPQGQPQTLPALIPESSNDDIVIATKPLERPTGPQTKPLPRPSQGQPQTLPALISESSNDDIVIATKPLPRPTGPQVQPAPIHPARVPQIEERPISAVAIPGEVEQDNEPQGQPQTLPALISESSNDDIVIATKPLPRPTGPQTKPLPRPSDQ